MKQQLLQQITFIYKHFWFPLPDGYYIIPFFQPLSYPWFILLMLNLFILISLSSVVFPLAKANYIH